jgi:hypothetical protein
LNHKRRRPKNRRGGCLLCKPWKANGGSRRDTPCPANQLRGMRDGTTRELIDRDASEAS